MVIFEGRHEQLPQALSLLPVRVEKEADYQILTLGNSNGAAADGWVDRLQRRFPHAQIVNNSQSGRTIGFDNGGRPALNALKNIDQYLNEAKQTAGKKPYDAIVICLGTNDTKYEFRGKADQVLNNFETLLIKIRKHRIVAANTRLIYVSPPPIGEGRSDKKYQGSQQQLAELVPLMKEKALAAGFEFVDVYHPPVGILDDYAPDGVHMCAEGQAIVADRIALSLIETDEP